MAESLAVVDPIIDLILPVSDEFLGSLQGELGGQERITMETLQELVRASGREPVSGAGGSASNVLRGLAAFGRTAAVAGCVGNDAFGRRYAREMEEAGVHTYLTQGEQGTSTCLSLVGPGGQRTMRTYIGASKELKTLDTSWFAGVRMMHLEGYALRSQELAVRAVELAKEAGAFVSMDLGSFELVRACKGRLLDFLERWVDILFGNELEARELTGCGAEEACDALCELCETVVVTRNKRGVWLRQGGEKLQLPAFVVQNPVDTTGAGDLYAAGFLHGRLSGFSLLDCGRLAAVTAAAVVQVVGASIPADHWPAIRQAAEAPSDLSFFEL